jgi:Sec-independent protein translocase protein TatA
MNYHYSKEGNHMTQGSDLAEHVTTLVAVIGGLSVLVQALVAVIFLGIKKDITDIKTAMTEELKSIKSSMSGFTVEVFDRLRKVEISIEKLWSEHRMTKELACDTCKDHHHSREEDK